MPFDILNAQLPNPSFFLQPDGSVSLGWFQWFLSVQKRTSTGVGNAGGQGVSAPALSNDITTLSGSVSSLSTSVSALGTQVTTISGSVSTLGSQVSSLSSSITTLTTQISTLSVGLENSMVEAAFGHAAVPPSLNPALAAMLFH